MNYVDCRLTQRQGKKVSRHATALLDRDNPYFHSELRPASTLRTTVSARIDSMDFKCLILVIVLAAVGRSSSTSVWTLIHDIVRNNVAGSPAIHQRTEWDFNPEQGKQRRVNFEKLNGRLGEDLIERLGVGMGFDGPWGSKVTSDSKPALRYKV